MATPYAPPVYTPYSYSFNPPSASSASTKAYSTSKSLYTAKPFAPPPPPVTRPTLSNDAPSSFPSFLFLATFVILLFTTWFYTASTTRRTFPVIRNKRICLLIAHPDDEAMFFAPTLLELTRRELGNHVKVLCLCSGNAENLGETRKKELIDSVLTLGLRHRDDVYVVDDPSFPDSMTTNWPAQKITSLLHSAFTRDASACPPQASIDLLLTFDAAGVSLHPNHTSLFHGARAYLASLMKGKDGWACPVELYSLRSVGVLRKYTGVFDAIVSMALVVLGGVKEGSAAKAGKLLFVSGPLEYWRAQRAMVGAHKSQMRWFRWGWILVSRYMVVNDLRREKIT